MESRSKKYNVIVSKRATGMLVSHASFLAQASETAGLKLTESFIIAANSLAVFRVVGDFHQPLFSGSIRKSGPFAYFICY